MKIQLALAALVLALSPSVFAQQRGNFGGQNGGRGGRTGGTLPLPKGVDRLISIDAYNMLLAETTDDNGDHNYTPIIVRHVYSGGIAALFGGTSIPTDQFVSPGASNNNGGGNRNGNFGVQGLGGGNNFNGNGNFGGNNFNGNGNFGGNNFNNGGNFGGNFGGATGFNGTGFNQGFNGAGNGQIFQTPNGNVGFGQTGVLNPDGTSTPLANGPFFGQ